MRSLVAFARSLQGELLTALNNRRSAAPLRRLVDEFHDSHKTDADDAFAAACAQTAACILAVVTQQPEELRRSEIFRWLAQTSEPLAREVFRLYLSQTADGDNDAESPLRRLDLPQRWEACEARRLLTAPFIAAGDPHATLHLFEDFLSLFDQKKRKRSGVYFTPPEIAAYVVHCVDHVLCDDFGLLEGLASTASWSSVGGAAARRGGKPFLRILDPAAGAGIFLVQVIRQTHHRLVEMWRADGVASSGVQQRWSEYAARHLLPRLNGLELMPAACALANINIASELAHSGFDFTDCPPPRVVCRDALGAPGIIMPNDTTAPFTVIVGNPPYAGVSHNRPAWIDDLLKGRLPDGRPTADYYEADGQPIGERKVWLQDDYVKFLRWAQAAIEEAGCGIVAMVTNHGFLDNVTFRGMRRQLMHAFPQIDVLDLHGNRKKSEQAPQGGRDENVFDIEQGVAISIFRRPCRSAAPAVRHADLWGARDEKLEALREGPQSTGRNGRRQRITPQTLSPAAPYYFFTPYDDSRQREYQQGLRLIDIMPLNTTAPVTARDGFVVALSETELLRRMKEFCDLSIPDDQIRRRYFANTRSAKYAPGDTRGWKLSDARRIAAADPDWKSHLARCLYRPFDWRPVYWTDWMIDWPRTPVMQHLIGGDNLALIARRQMLASRPCDYFWITDCVALDGVVRSDNRGSESLFPLYLDEPALVGSTSARRANFTDEYVQLTAAALQWRWRPLGGGDLCTTFGPEDLLHYIYACFHSQGYRQRYADCLRLDFPRVFATARRELFCALCKLGKLLVDLHLLREPPPQAAEPSGDRQIAPGYPKYREGRVAINSTADFTNVARDVWKFQVGAHQVCRKWLRDRRGRKLSDYEIAHYHNLVAAVRETIDVMRGIDNEIDRHGGWPAAFNAAQNALKKSRQGAKKEQEKIA